MDDDRVLAYIAAEPTADVTAHVGTYAPPLPQIPNGRKSVLDRLWVEALRLGAVALVALFGSYLVISREHGKLFEKERATCTALNLAVANQRTVLLAELAMIDSINQLVGPNLDARIDPITKGNVLSALSRLPEDRIC